MMPSTEEKSVTRQPILWRRLDQPGHESARLSFHQPYWHLTGTAVFAHERQPCRLDYLIICDPRWNTSSAKVTGWVANKTIQIQLSVDSARHWRLNAKECPDIAGCIDLDLNFSPSTNLLPIRRLGLEIGQQAEVKAAWLRFPSFVLEPLEQIYCRLDTRVYRYESGGGRFVTELEVNEEGFVTHYPKIWAVEPAEPL
jgi:hypothetical protein